MTFYAKRLLDFSSASLIFYHNSNREKCSAPLPSRSRDNYLVKAQFSSVYLIANPLEKIKNFFTGLDDLPFQKIISSHQVEQIPCCYIPSTSSYLGIPQQSVFTAAASIYLGIRSPIKRVSSLFRLSGSIYGMYLCETSIRNYSVLNGRVKSVPCPSAVHNQMLTQNLALGKEILTHTKNIESRNYMNKSRDLNKMTDNEYNALCELLFVNINEIRAKDLACQLKLIPLWRSGNCAEVSLCGAYFAVQKTRKTIEVAQIENGDHVFIVIGSNVILDQEAVICDPWAGGVYPASQLRHLHDFLGFISIKDRSYTCVAPFNRNIQSLGTKFIFRGN